METKNQGILRIAGIVRESYTDGVGVRCTVFTQGCSHNCFNCHNPETHDFNGGYLLNNEALLSYLKANPLLSGVTFSGGDPMFQPDAVSKLAKRIKEETKLDIWCYSGFLYEELIKNPKTLGVLQYTDVLVDGPYVEEKRQLTLRFRGSSNQRIIDIPRSLIAGHCVEYTLV